MTLRAAHYENRGYDAPMHPRSGWPRRALLRAADGVQYVAVQSCWGVDAQRMQGALDDIRGAKTDVPQGGVIWVFAVKR